MYVNGRRVDYETYARERAPVVNRDWRTYLGRPLRESDGYYANTLVDNLEFYNAYRLEIVSGLKSNDMLTVLPVLITSWDTF
jgi:hypothetical protein